MSGAANPASRAARVRRSLSSAWPTTGAGGVATGIGALPGPMGLAWRAAKPFLLSPQQGANAVLVAALNPEAAGVTGLYWKRGRQARPNRLALDEGRRERLWTELERLTGAG